MSSIFIHTQEDHEFKLDHYEGPLDLLLSMIKEAKIDIKDIFVSKITDQYIEYIRSMEILDMDKASDFIAMAATLLEIKSGELLPKIEMLEEDTYYEDEKQELKRQLEMYSLIQDAAQAIQAKETRFRFYRDPVFDENDCRLVLSGSTFDQLLDAFAAVLHKLEFVERIEEPKSIEKDVHTVAEKVVYLAKLISTTEKVKFFDLFVNDNSRSAVLNTFLAILELLKRQVISACQEERFGDIVIEAKEGGENISLEDFENEES